MALCEAPNGGQDIDACGDMLGYNPVIKPSGDGRSLEMMTLDRCWQSGHTRRGV